MHNIAVGHRCSSSLNDRFTRISQLREQQQQQQYVVGQYDGGYNARLAREMELRPSVQGALSSTCTPAVATPAMLAPTPFTASLPAYNQESLVMRAAGDRLPPPRLHVKQRLAIRARLGALRSDNNTGADNRAILKRLQLPATRGGGTVKQANVQMSDTGGAPNAAVLRRRNNKINNKTNNKINNNNKPGLNKKKVSGTGAELSRDLLDRELDEYMSACEKPPSH